MDMMSRKEVVKFLSGWKNDFIAVSNAIQEKEKSILKKEFDTRLDLMGAFAKTQDKEIIRLREKVMKLRTIIRSIIIWSKEKLNEL